MPWKETSVMNVRTEFVLRVFEAKVPFNDLCKEFGISRKTGYKWKERFLENGLEGLSDQSRRPVSSPQQLGENSVCSIVKLKLAHPSWGPRKIRMVFARSFPDCELPSDSTFKRVLDNSGLVERKTRKPSSESGRISNRIEAKRPNHVWTVDFKGWWRTGDNNRFEPLTIRDLYSRFVLCTQALSDSKTDSVKTAFERVFSTYGLPEVIRSDNGSPFAASNSPMGLSRLSAWWLALGIDLDRIPPARPDQNGAHERMHRDIAHLRSRGSQLRILSHNKVHWMCGETRIIMNAPMKQSPCKFPQIYTLNPREVSIKRRSNWITHSVILSEK